MYLSINFPICNFSSNWVSTTRNLIHAILNLRLICRYVCCIWFWPICLLLILTFVTDFDLRSISDICVSLTYISLKGCISVSDAAISSLICRCLKLDSILACDTYFGQQSVLALCSSSACDDRATTEHRRQNIPQASNLKLLHMGGCKGVQVISKLIL